MESKVDVAIIGAGIAGTSIAYALADRGAKTAIFDKRSFGAGNSGKSSGLVRHFYSTELAMKMTKLARETWSNFASKIGEPLAFYRNRMVVLPREEMRDGIEKVAVYMKKNRLKCSFLTRSSLRKALPGSVLDDVSFGFLDAEAGYVSDPLLAVTTLGRVAQRLGAHYHPFTKVTGIDVADGRVRGVITDKGRVEANCVVNAAGSGARELGKVIGIDLPISSERQQIVVVKPTKKMSATYPTVIDYIKNIYVRPEISGSVIIGSGERGVPANPDNFNEGAENGSVELLMRLGAERFQFLKHARILRAYAGLYDVTPDDYPIIGELESVKGFVNACGFSHGFKLGPAVGKVVSELILDRDYQSIDLTPLKFERFERHELIKPFLGKSGGGTG